MFGVEVIKRRTEEVLVVGRSVWLRLVGAILAALASGLIVALIPLRPNILGVMVLSLLVLLGSHIALSHASVTFRKAPDEEARGEFLAVGGDRIKDAVFLYTGSMDVAAGGKTQSVNIEVSDTPIDKFVGLHTGETAPAWPGNGEAVIDYRLALDCGLSVGESITLSDSDLNTLTVTVTDIFDN